MSVLQVSWTSWGGFDITKLSGWEGVSATFSSSLVVGGIEQSSEFYCILLLNTMLWFVDYLFCFLLRFFSWNGLTQGFFYVLLENGVVISKLASV